MTDCVDVVQYIRKKAENANGVKVLPSAAITVGEKGEELTDMAALKAAGVCGFSEDGRSVSNLLKMREAMMMAKSLDMPIFDHTQQHEISDGGCMHRGRYSELLGVLGIPPEAEEMMTIRDILLAKETGCRLHLSHISTGACLDLIRTAKSWGIPVTAETAPHYFTLTDADVAADDAAESYHISETVSGRRADTHRKMNPPLRSESDRIAVIRALMDRNHRRYRYGSRSSCQRRKSEESGQRTVRRHRAGDEFRCKLHAADSSGTDYTAASRRASEYEPGADSRIRRRNASAGAARRRGDRRSGGAVDGAGPLRPRRKILRLKE